MFSVPAAGPTRADRTRPSAARQPSRRPAAGWPRRRQDDVRYYSINIPNFGDFSDPRLFADLARAAEEAGWDAVLTWDALVSERWRRSHIADPWILLAAAGLATSRIRLGTAVTPLGPPPGPAS